VTKRRRGRTNIRNPPRVIETVGNTIKTKGEEGGGKKENFAQEKRKKP